VNWQPTLLKHIARFGYGDALPKESRDEIGSTKVFGSNGAYSYFSEANTGSPVIIIGRKGSYGKVNWSDEPVFAADTTFFVDASKTRQDLRWLFHALQALNLDKGSNEAAVPGLNREDAYASPMLLPSLPEQHAIAVFLDRETARMDALIARNQRLLDLLVERRQALITQAVTKGLDPEAPMRDSGVACLGEMPSHWRVARLKSLISSIDTGFSPRSYNIPAPIGGWGVLKTGCVNGGTFHPHENKTLPDDLDPPLSFEVKVGDILMSRASGSADLIANVAMIEEQPQARLLLSDKIFRLETRPSDCDPKLLVIAMNSSYVRRQILAIISGAAGLANNVTQADINELHLLLPPSEEQSAIVTYVNERLARPDALRDKVQALMGCLKERRAALISEAVTGKINVMEQVCE